MIRNGKFDPVFLLVAFLTAFLAIGLGIAAYKAVIPWGDPLNLEEFNISTNKAHPGDIICFQFVGQKLYNTTADITVELVNGEAFHLMSYDSEHPVSPAGTHFNSRCFVVPKLVNGEYRIRWTGNHKVNIFNYKRQQFLSDPITITADPCKDGAPGKDGKDGKPGKNFWGK